MPALIQPMRCSIVIPSFKRGQIALDSIYGLLAMPVKPTEILLVDQTPKHPPVVEEKLGDLALAGHIRWLRLDEPSIPHAMNVGLQAATGDIVLFLDDDIVTSATLVDMHLEAHRAAVLVAGMVLQPGEKPERLRDGEPFRFNSTASAQIEEFIGCNFSVRRAEALALGGFDENFTGAAYRYEAEFAWRCKKVHGLIQYEPRAWIHHLAVPTGGTRAHGHHLRTVRPTHSVGAYYCLLRTRPNGWLRQMAWRPLRSVRTRHHLHRPWWIPVTLLAELRGIISAIKLVRRGPRLLNTNG